MNLALSPDQVQKIAGQKISMVKYSSLHQFSNIDELFKKGTTDCLLILYETSMNNGHWTGLIKRPDKIYFFD